MGDFQSILENQNTLHNGATSLITGSCGEGFGRTFGAFQDSFIHLFLDKPSDFVDY